MEMHVAHNVDLAAGGGTGRLHAWDGPVLTAKVSRPLRWITGAAEMHIRKGVALAVPLRRGVGSAAEPLTVELAADLTTAERSKSLR